MCIRGASSFVWVFEIVLFCLCWWECWIISKVQVISGDKKRGYVYKRGVFVRLSVWNRSFFRNNYIRKLLFRKFDLYRVGADEVHTPTHTAKKNLLLFEKTRILLTAICLKKESKRRTAHPHTDHRQKEGTQISRFKTQGKPETHWEVPFYKCQFSSYPELREFC